MKSPLVDALRQAKGDVSDDASENQPVAAPGESPQDSGAASYSDTTELALLENQEGVIPDGDVVPGPDSGDDDKENLPAADSKPFSATAMLDAGGANLSAKTSVFEKAGRMAPVLCLVAMSFAAGGYMLLTRPALDNINVGISDRSDRTIPVTENGTESIRWQDLPATDVSLVTQAEVRNSSRAEPATAGSQQPVEANSVTAGRRPPANTETRPDRNIQIGVTRNVESVVNDRAFSQVSSAFDAYRRQDYESAENHYSQALKIEPYHSDALAGLAAVYQQTGRDKLAVDTYQKLLGFDPGNTRAASAIISLRTKEADWDTESDLKYLLQRFPGAHHLHFALGSYFVGEDRWADARHEFLAAHELAPRNADYSFNVAVSMENLGEYGSARTYYEIALETAGESSNIDKDEVTAHLSVMLALSGERP